MRRDILALSKLLGTFNDYQIVFENHYIGGIVTSFSKIVEIVIRPDLNMIKIRLGEDDTDIDNL